MLIFGIIENIKGVSYPLIKEEFGTSWEQHGFMVSMFSVAYVGFSIIAGIFLGRFGMKPPFLFGFGAICIGLFSVFFMQGFFPAASALFVIFAGFGFLEVGVNALASRLFLTKTALLMNLLNSIYGIGAMIGPRAAVIITNNARFDWRYVYLFSLPLALLLFVPAVFTRFPGDSTEFATRQTETADAAGCRSFFDTLKSPLVWLMSVTLGLAVIIEMNSPNWGPMYFRDLYRLNPSTGGAAFISAFFFSFTVSRLVCGPLVERIGCIRTLLGVGFIILAVFIAGFLLGERGIYMLPVLGFFIALLWPTIMATAVHCFGRDAPICSSAMIAIGGLLNAAVQFVIGLTNKIFGSAWGYRSTVIYTALFIFVLFLLNRKLRNKGT